MKQHLPPQRTPLHCPTAARRAARSEALPFDLQDELGNQALLESLAAGMDPLDSFPHAGALDRHLGAELPGKSVVDPAGCAARGVEAYTDGLTTHFRSAAPRLAVAAHEAAHQLQHAGLTCDAGLGAEGHAEAVAHEVTDGRSAAGLLGSEGVAVSGRLHTYLEIAETPQASALDLGWQGHGQGALKVSDDGQLAVPAADGDGNQRAWATPEHIQASNNTLQAMGSGIRLEAGPVSLVGKAPDGWGEGPERGLAEVVVTETDGAAPMEIVADCGKAAYEIMGGHDDNDMGAAVVRDGQGGTTTTDPHPYQNRWEDIPGTVGTTELWFREILRMAYGHDLSVEQLIALYQGQTPDERAAFEARYGLNAAAVPEVGESVAMSALYDSPDFTKDESLSQSWPWHFAACVLRSGGDYITLENVFGTTPSSWFFRMYGPAGYGQSFYDQESPTGAFGDPNVAMVARPQGHMRLVVTVPEDADLLGDAELYLRVTTGMGPHQTEVQPVAPGAPATFVVPLAHLIPDGESQSIAIRVLDADLWSDDALLDLTWSPPFLPSRYTENGVTLAGEMIP